jgi:Thermostable hemolysin
MLEISFNSDALVRGTLFMDEQRIRRLTDLLPSGISLTQGFGPDRERVEYFIESTYRREYDSVIAHHYPTLMSVYDSFGTVLAAVGLRMALGEALFLEQYLAQPVECSVGQALGKSVGRAAIVEIGNLASAGKGASVFLFVALAAYLREQDLAVAVVTGTKALRRSLASFGVEFLELGRAEPAALPDHGASWGRYYQRDPRVIAGAIDPAFARLEPYLPAEHNGNLKLLFARLHPRSARYVQ